VPLLPLKGKEKEDEVNANGAISLLLIFKTLFDFDVPHRCKTTSE
jgi:hypothetical protein